MTPVLLPADLATPLLEILGVQSSKFYNLYDLDVELYNYLTNNTSVKIDDDLLFTKRIKTYEDLLKTEIDQRLKKYEEEEEKKVRNQIYQLQKRMTIGIQQSADQ